VLVEVGSRPHGGEGTFVKMADRAIGYNQLSVMIDAHENRSKFYSLPERPRKHKESAMEVCMVSRQEGHLAGIPLENEIRSLASFVDVEWNVTVGQNIPITVDFITNPGAVLLVHKEKEVVEADQAKIHEMELNGLFDIRRVRLDTL
jgi:hypothetical protein